MVIALRPRAVARSSAAPYAGALDSRMKQRRRVGYHRKVMHCLSMLTHSPRGWGAGARAGYGAPSTNIVELKAGGTRRRGLLSKKREQAQQGPQPSRGPDA